jgi:Cu/Ag efflux protein CusF
MTAVDCTVAPLQPLYILYFIHEPVDALFNPQDIDFEVNYFLQNDLENAQVRVPLLCILFVVTVAVATTVSCNRSGAKGQAGSSDPKVFAGTGVVQNVDRRLGAIEIDHEEIKGYMPAMSMPYHIKDTSLLDKVAPGDKVNFKIEDSGFGPLLIEIDKQTS